MYIAALPHRLAQHLPDRLPQTRMIVADDKLHPLQPPLLQLHQKVPPDRRRFPVGQLHRQHVPPPLPIHPDGDQHRLAPDHPVHPHLLVARIQNHVRVGFLQPALGELLQLRVQRLVRPAHRRRRHLVAAQILRDRLHLPRRHPLDVHLRQRPHQSLLAPLIAFKHLRPEPPLPLLRHPQLQLPHARRQRPAVVARPGSQAAPPSARSCPPPTPHPSPLPAPAGSLPESAAAETPPAPPSPLCAILPSGHLSFPLRSCLHPSVKGLA